MQFPLLFNDVSLLLAVIATILLTTSELISPRYLKTDLLIEKGRLRIIALIVGVLFLSTVTIRIYQIFITI